MSHKHSRRALLKGLGASAAFLPLLDADRGFGATPFPKRIICVATPNGVLQNMYWPTGGETDFTIPTGTTDVPWITAPLNDVKSDVILVKGINMLSAAQDTSVHGAHDNFPHIFSGGNSYTAPYPTIDQFLSSKLNPQTKFKALVLACMVQWGAKNQARISWTGNGQAVTPEESPLNLYKQLFGAGFKPVGQTDSIDKLLKERRSVLDVVGKDLARLQTRLSGEDRQKLDVHVNAIRDLEQRLDPKFAAASSCMQPALAASDGTLDVQAVPNYPRVAQLQMDLAVEALACDLTRIVTLQFSNAAANQMVFSWLGAEFTQTATLDGAGRPEFGPLHNHHEISHHGQTLKNLKSKIENWYHAQAAYLIKKLKSKREGTGTLLDNTAVMWVNNMHDGGAHSEGPNLPVVLAGSAGGYFKTGRFIDLGTQSIPHNRILLSLCQAMGADVTTFGDPKYCTDGPFDRLRG